MLVRQFFVFYIIGFLASELVFCARYSSTLIPFHDSRCPPDMANDCYDRISELHEAHLHVLRGAMNADKEIPVVTGLSQVLNMFDKSGFLVILTDFRGAWFADLTFPIILRKMRPAWLWSKRNTRAIFVQDEVLKRKLNLTQNLAFFSKSPYWTDIAIDNSIFMTFLNASSFWNKAASWNSLVSISLFPWVQNYDIFNNFMHSHKLVECVAELKRSNNIFPSSLSSIKIFITYPAEHSHETVTRFLDLFTLSKSALENSITHETFYLVNTSFTSFGISIGILRLIHLCRNNFNLQIKYTDGPYSLSEAINLSHISSACCQTSPNLNNVVLYFGKGDKTNEIRLLENALQICNLGTKIKGSEKVTNISLGYASVWLSILGNFSYTKFTNWICDNGRIISMETETYRKVFHIKFVIKQTFVPSYVSNTLNPVTLMSVENDLKLIIHGYRGTESLPFLELFNIFDENVWFSLIILVFAYILILQQVPGLRPQLNVSQAAFIQVMLLLEQGNHFLNPKTFNYARKYITGVLLFMGIILSNSYRNTNMYNVIIPRKLVEYQYLQDLVDDNITINTRSLEDGILHQLPSQRSKSWDTLDVHISKLHARTYDLHVEGLGQRTEVILKSEVDVLQKKIRKSGSTFVSQNTTNLLLKVSSLMEFTSSVLKDVVKQLELNNVRGLPGRWYLEQFLKVEVYHLLRIVRTSPKAALALPSYMGFDFVKMLEEKGNADVYQGKETFYEVNIVFNLRGLAPQYLVRRAKHAEICGLWKRWQNLFKKKLPNRNERKSEQPKKPTMAGNISVIFTLLISGLTVSLFSLCIELTIKRFSCHQVCGQLEQLHKRIQ